MSQESANPSSLRPQFELLEPRLLLSSYTLVGDHYLDVGNQSTFSAHVSVLDGSPVSVDTTATLQVSAGASIAGYDTTRVQMDTGLGYYEKDYVYRAASSINTVKWDSTIQDEVCTVRNSDPLEFMPVSVNDTDNNALVGQGQFDGVEISDPGDTWTQTNTSRITFLKLETLSLTVNSQSMSIPCVNVYIKNSWTDSWGDSGYDEYTYWLNEVIGIVKAQVTGVENGSTRTQYDLTMTGYTLAKPWQEAGAGDFDANGSSDVLWWNRNTWTVGAWLTDSGTHLPTSWLAFGTISPLDWEVGGVGKFDGNSYADILWRNKSSGLVGTWLRNGSTISWATVGTVAYADWEIGAVGNLDNDAGAYSDILWRNKTSGVTGAWTMSGTTPTGWIAFGTISCTDWEIGGIGKYDGNAYGDILFRNKSSGLVGAWLRNDSSISWTTITACSYTDWQIGGIGDWHGSGLQDDILWRNRSSGLTGAWLMNGTSISSWLALGVVS